MKHKKELFIAMLFLAAFAAWTVLVCLVDVRGVGPAGSCVGFATLNQQIHSLTGTNMALYTVTDWLGLLPIFTALGFGILGLIQWIGRRRLLAVDRSILALGIFYVTVITVFFFFEMIPINYRPVLIDGRLEASYPSSTTLLTMCVMPTAAIELNRRVKCRALRLALLVTLASFTTFMVIGRLLSGVHWISDIIGGALVSAGLVTLYDAFTRVDRSHTN